MQAIFIRHGLAESNTGVLQRKVGQYAALSDKGRAQITQAAAFLKDIITAKVIYASPYPRTVQSAEILAEILSVKIVIEPRLQEINKGVWQMPTLAFQKELYPQRDWAKPLLEASQKPELTLQNWIQRDHEYNQVVEAQAKAAGQPYLWIKPGQSLETTLQWAERQLQLAKTAS